MWLLRHVSLPHLALHKGRTLLTFLGIAIGVGAIVATSSVTDAVLRSFRRTIEATSGRAELHVTNSGAGVPEPQLETIRTLPGVGGAAPVVTGTVSIMSPSADTLVIFGLDLLSDEEHEAQIPRSALHLDDEVVFVSRPDSVALESDFARTHGFDLGSTLEVATPLGTRALVVRGLVDAAGPASLYGGAVGLMDLPAGQRLLGKDGKVDRIDVRLAEGADRAAVVERLERAVEGVGRVEDSTTAGARAEELLFSLRVALGIAALVAAMVGFFIIYHTISVSVFQRRREIATVSTFGLSGRAILGWLCTESLILGGLAAAAGLGIGVALARLAVSTFATVATAWVQLPAETPSLTPSGAALAIAVGLLTTTVATVTSVWPVVATPPARFLRPSHTAPPGASVRRQSIAALFGFLLTALLVFLSPRTLPHASLVAFVFVLNCLVLASFALLSPLVLLRVGRTLHRLADRLPGLSVLLASSSFIRNPSAPAAVIAAIVMGLGWSLAQSSLTASMEYSWITWLDEHYTSDLIVTASPATVSFLTDPPIAEAVADGLRELPGVGQIQGLRNIEAKIADHPAVVLGLDRAPQGLPLVDGDWAEVAPEFWAGQGAAVSDNLARKRGIRPGDTVELATPTGALPLRVLGVFADYQNAGDLGCVAVARSILRARWEDRLVTRIRVWLVPGTPLEPVRREIERRYGMAYGLHVLSAKQARAAVTDLVHSAFSISYGLVLVALVISFVGVLNFLLAAVLDRHVQLRTLTALGLTRRQISAVIVTEGALIGLAGAIVGVIAGIVMSSIIVHHSVPMVNGWRFTWVIPTRTAVVLALTVFALSAIAGLPPARLGVRRRTAPEERWE